MAMQRLLAWLRLGEEALISLLLTAMVVIASAQILLRNLFDSGLHWADPLLRLLVLWLTMLGALLATRHNEHIRIDLLSRYLSPGWRRLSDSIALLFSTLVCALLAWHSARFVIDEYHYGGNILGQIPVWWGQVILPLGFTLITLRFALLTLQSLRGRLP